jgi:hypothetical protein
MLGQKVAQGDSDTIDLSLMQKGVYLIQIEFSDHQKVTEKIIRK